MAETFNNIYVYSLTPETATVDMKQILPVKWKDPETGVQYSNLYLLTEPELNDLGWWRVYEEHDSNSPTQYETETIDTFVWRGGDFLATYIVVYKDLETVRAIKIASLETERDQNILDTIDHRTAEEHYENIYHALAVLINAFAQGTAAQVADYVNTNAFCQNLKTKVANLAGETTAYDDRITLAETENDIPTLIAL